MTDTTNTSTAVPADDIRARNKDLIFAALADAGIDKVTIEYDGSGDSGQIDDVLAWRAHETVPFPSDLKLQLAQSNPDHPLTETDLAEAIKSLAWDFLEERHAGWEINDGGFGTFVFDVGGRTITLEHNERFTDYDTTTHEF
jgi:hypothetical protein